MSATPSIQAEKLARLLGSPSCPLILDVRPDEEHGWVPASIRLRAEDAAHWAPQFLGQKVVVTCVRGHDRSDGAAAILRNAGVQAEILEGGIAAWKAAGLPLIDPAKLPPRDESGRTTWVTRARPKVDRIACPWLIRRFVDPKAVFLFVAPTHVGGVAERFGAAPFDVDGVFWSHRGEQCSFDTMIEEFGLSGLIGLERMAPIVRGADTARPDLAPQATGLLALSLGLSRMFTDDLEQLEAGMLVYDALYRWCRDAVDETHDWVSHQPKQARQPAIA